MEARKKWVLPLGLAAVVLLILWGALGVGTASKLFPEKPKALPSVTAPAGASSFSALSQEESRASMMRHPMSGESRLLIPFTWRR